MKSNKKQVRRGHCENFFNCALADNGDIQEIPTGDDFVCSLCGLELVEEQEKKKNWIWLCLGAVVIIAIVLLSIRKCGNHNPDIVVIVDTVYNECGDTLYLEGTDTIEIKKNTSVDITYSERGDTILVTGCDTIDIKPYVEKPEPGKREEGGVVIPRGLPVYGNYYGPRNASGEPHGKGGRVEVKYSYHMGDKFVELQPGDVVNNTVYEHGELKHGRIDRAKGGIQEF